MSQQSSWERWAPLSGVAFVVLIITGFIIAGSSPDSSDSNVKIAAYLAKDSNQSKNIVAWLLLMVAMLFVVGFYVVLRNRLVAAEGGTGQRGALALGAGIASTVFLITAISIFVSPLITADDADKFRVDPGPLPADAGPRLHDLGGLSGRRLARRMGDRGDRPPNRDAAGLVRVVQHRRRDHRPVRDLLLPDLRLLAVDPRDVDRAVRPARAGPSSRSSWPCSPAA